MANRHSTIGFNRPEMVIVVPSGSIDTENRASLLSLYSGIEVGADAPWSVAADSEDTWAIKAD